MDDITCIGQPKLIESIICIFHNIIHDSSFRIKLLESCALVEKLYVNHSQVKDGSEDLGWEEGIQNSL